MPPLSPLPLLRRFIPSFGGEYTLLAGGSARSYANAVAAAPALSPLTTSTAVFAAANTLGFAISLATNSHHHLDLLGTGAFAVSALATRGVEARQQLSAVAVAIWGAKLAGFLFYRVCSTGRRDARLEKTLSSPSGAFGFWSISFLWGALVSLPHTIAAAVPLAARPALLGGGAVMTAASLALVTAGLVLETLADAQKFAFKSDAANSGKFCDVGVWQLSQHPNYLGNLLVWTGVFALNAPTLLAPYGGALRRFGRLAAGALSPLFMIALFYGQATGKVGDSVALADKKYGDDPKYQSYVAETPLIVPSPTHLLRTIRENRRPKTG